MVDVLANLVNFQLNNATGSQTITDPNGPGSSPKAALFCLSRATADATFTASMGTGYGITDGTTHRCTGFMGEDALNAVSADAGRRVDNATVMVMCGTASQTLDYEAAFSSFGTNTVTITNSAAREYRGWVMLFYGDDVEASVNDLAGSVSIGGIASVSGLAFAPDAVIAVYANSTFVADTGLGNVINGLGFAGRLPSISQAYGTLACGDRKNPTQAGTRVGNNGIVMQVTGAIANGARLDLTSFNSGGFTVTTRDVGAIVNATYLSLRLGGMKCTAVCPSLTTSSTGEHSYTGITHRAMAMLAVATRADTVNTLDTGHGSMGLGAVSVMPGHTESSAGAVFRDGISPSIAYSIYGNTTWGRALSGSATHSWISSFISFDATGFTYNIITASAADKPVPLFFIGDVPRIVSEDTEQISESVAIARGLPLSETERISESVSFARTQPLSETEQISESVAFARTQPLSETEQISESVAFARTQALSETERISESVAFARSLSLSETEQISESIAFARTQPFSETESVVESVAFAAAQALAESVDISESVVLVAVGNAILIAVAETEQISESTTLIVGRFLQVSETEEISESVTLTLTSATALEVSEVEEISEGVFLALGEVITSGDTEEITENVRLLTSIAIFDLTDTEQISESALLIPGQVIGVSETVELSESSNIGAGIDSRMKATRAGLVFQW